MRRDDNGNPTVFGLDQGGFIAPPQNPRGAMVSVWALATPATAVGGCRGRFVCSCGCLCCLLRCLCHCVWGFAKLLLCIACSGVSATAFSVLRMVPLSALDGMRRGRVALGCIPRHCIPIRGRGCRCSRWHRTARVGGARCGVEPWQLFSFFALCRSLLASRFLLLLASCVLRLASCF